MWLLLGIGPILVIQGVLSDLSAPRVALTRHLLSADRYDKRAMPANNLTGKVAINLAVIVNRINALDDRNQWLQWTGYVNATWYNPFLTWDPEQWNGTRLLLLKEGDMWVPDVAILQRLDDDIGFGDQRRRLIRVHHDGQITWFLGGGIITTSCPINVRKFPFDHQTCSMQVGSYTISSSEIETVDDKSSKVDRILGVNGLWDVTEASSRLTHFSYESPHGREDYTYLLFTLHLKRKSAYFVLNIVIPVMVMAMLMCMVFLLPADGGEKIGFSITLLLAFNVIQLVIVDWMPQTSDSLPIIAFYVTTLLTMSAVCIPISVFVIYIHNNGPSKLPACLRRLVETRCRRLDKNTGNLEIHMNDIREYPEKVVENETVETEHSNNVDMEIMRELKAKRRRFEKKVDEEFVTETWKEAAEVLDRIFFHGTVALLVLITLFFVLLILV